MTDSHHDHKSTVAGEHSPREIAKFALVIALVFVCSLALTNIFGPMSYMGWSRWFMGSFFVVFASFKFAGYNMFAMMFAGYDIIAKHFKPYGYAYPFIELGLGLTYLLDWAPDVRDIFTLIVMLVSSVGVYQEIRKRSGIHCACLGNIIKLPLSTVSFVEDAGMAIMALVMLLVR